MEDFVKIIFFLAIMLIGLLGSGNKKKPAPRGPARPRPRPAPPLEEAEEELVGWAPSSPPEAPQAPPRGLDPFEDEIIASLRAQLRGPEPVEEPTSPAPAPVSPPARKPAPPPLARSTPPVLKKPVAAPAPRRTLPATPLLATLRSGPEGLRNAILLGTVLGPPKALEDGERGRPGSHP